MWGGGCYVGDHVLFGFAEILTVAPSGTSSLVDEPRLGRIGEN